MILGVLNIVCLLGVAGWFYLGAAREKKNALLWLLIGAVIFEVAFVIDVGLALWTARPLIQVEETTVTDVVTSHYTSLLFGLAVAAIAHGMLLLKYSIIELVDKVNAWQQGTTFRVVATVIGLAGVATMFWLGQSDRAALVPEVIRQDLLVNCIMAAILVAAVTWLNHSLTALFALLAAGWICTWLPAENREIGVQATVGFASLIVTFLVSVQLLRLLFDLPWKPLAVARLLLEEALKMKIALIFIVMLIGLVPLLTTRLEPDERLQYRVQTFLSYGTGLSYAILAVMTLFVSTASVAFEQRDKQIYQVVTKPLDRFSYVLGKWIGVMGLNAVLLGVIGGSVFWFTQFLADLPAIDDFDSLATSEQVLTARVGVPPTLPDFSDTALERVQRRIELDPELEDNLETRQTQFEEEMTRLRAAELTLNPGEDKEYTFNNLRPLSRTQIFTATTDFETPITLDTAIKTPYDVEITDMSGEIVYSLGTHYGLLVSDPAKIVFVREADQPDGPKIQNGQRVRVTYFPENALTLRFKINAGDDDPGVSFPITIVIESLPFVQVQEVVLIQTQTMLIPAGAVADDGSLKITIINGNWDTRLAGPMTFTFPPDGLELMYKVSSFESNYFRAMLIVWIKLGFLAMLGIAAATFASFPVACLLAFAIFFGAETGPYLAEALEYYETSDVATEKVYYHKILIKTIAQGVNMTLNAYGDIRPTKNLIEGRLVSWGSVFKTFLNITVVWTGLTCLVGWFVFRSRQVAIYSGHA